MAKGTWLYVFLALAVSAPVSSATEPVTLRFTLQVPASNPQLGLSVVQFKEEVERETQRSVRVEIIDRGKLYIDDQVVGAVQSGAIEMGLAGINQISRRLPAADIMEQPFLFNFAALTHAAVSSERELRKLLDRAVLETIGVRVLWWQTAGPQVFMAKALDVASPERIRSKSVRVYSASTASMTERCGGSPKIMSITNVHDALRDGSIEVAMTAVVAVETRDLWKVADTITRTDHASIEFLVIVNEKAWQRLTDQQRIIVLAAAKRAEREVRERSSKLEDKAYEFARSKGMKVRELTPDEVAEWRACSADVLATYMNSGGELVRQLLAAYGKLRTDPCCSAGPMGSFNQR
jgi:C4-dicarboxylate-binding protein DctP